MRPVISQTNGTVGGISGVEGGAGLMDRRQADHLYLRKVAAAGGYRNYARDHLNSLANIFSPKFSCRGLPPEMVRRVVEYAFDVGAHFRGH